MKQQYITAVLEMLKSGKESGEVLSGLKETLKKRGHLALEASILNGVLRVIEAKNLSSVTVTVANEASFEAQSTVIKVALKELGAEAASSVKIDETIIGGFIAETKNIRHDASYKTKLVNLYRSLTQ